MKLKNIQEVKDFLDAVDRCKGNVYLVSPEGEKLGLKSMFCRYISMGRLLSDEGDNLELFCDNAEDEGNFYKFFNLHESVVADMSL